MVSRSALVEPTKGVRQAFTIAKKVTVSKAVLEITTRDQRYRPFCVPALCCISESGLTFSMTGRGTKRDSMTQHFVHQHTCVRSAERLARCHDRPKIPFADELLDVGMVLEESLALSSFEFQHNVALAQRHDVQNDCEDYERRHLSGCFIESRGKQRVLEPLL